MTPWRFPFTPEPPDFRLDWPGLFEHFRAHLAPMATTPQDPEWHAEGDVLLHTRMVCEALVLLPAWRALGPQDRAVAFAGALFHDLGKPATTRVEDGRVRSPGHSRRGQLMTRRLLFMEDACRAHRAPVRVREAVAGLVLHHGMPLWAMTRPDAAFRLHAASQLVSMPLLALVAEADVRGRECADQGDLLERVELFAELCRDEGCWQGPRAFASEVARFTYLAHQGAKPLEYVPHEDFACEAVLLVGLPASGKDTWVTAHAGERPVVHLDSLRAELGVAPEGDQAPVVAEARQRAREHLRARRGLVWNATNTTRALRVRLVDLFMRYRARVRLVYREAPFEELLRRNAARPHPVPEAALRRLAGRLEVPGPEEAHHLVWPD